jgi:archaeosine-15-forming tRNA-guanine transglycosylase
MANYATKFASASYSGGYTSNVVRGNLNDNSNQPRGVVQIDITSGTVDLQMRLTDEAPWFSVKTYDADTVEEVVIAPQMRVVVSDTAECWLAETH